MLSGVTFFVLFVAEPVWARAFHGPEGAVTGLRRQFVRLGWMMLALSVASGFVWLVVLASRLTGQSLQAAMAGGGVWKVLTETRFGNDWLVRAVLAVLIAISINGSSRCVDGPRAGRGSLRCCSLGPSWQASHGLDTGVRTLAPRECSTTAAAGNTRFALDMRFAEPAGAHDMGNPERVRLVGLVAKLAQTKAKPLCGRLWTMTTGDEILTLARAAKSMSRPPR
jgi:hypothetical protein